MGENKGDYTTSPQLFEVNTIWRQRNFRTTIFIVALICLIEAYILTRVSVFNPKLDDNKIELPSSFSVNQLSSDKTWLTFSDRQHGIEFKYPRDGKVEIPDARNGAYGYRIQNYQYGPGEEEPGLTPDEYYIEFDLPLSLSPCRKMVADPKIITLDDGVIYQGYYAESGGDPGGAQFILCAERPQGNFYLRITEDDAQGSIAEAVFSSFKFTEQLKTYVSEKNGFLFQYPESWTVDRRNQGEDEGFDLFIRGADDPDDVLGVSFGGVGIKNFLERLAADQGKKIERSSRLIGGYVADYFENIREFGPYDAFLLKRGDQYISVSDYGLDQALLDQILSSFIFFDPGHQLGNIFDLYEVRIGEKIGNLTIDRVRPFNSSFGEVKPDNVIIDFHGELILKGDYQPPRLDGQIFSEEACFGNINSESLSQIPWIRGDGRVIQFCFSNTEDAVEALGTETRSVTIAVDRYSIASYPAEVLNIAQFLRLINNH